MKNAQDQTNYFSLRIISFFISILIFVLITSYYAVYFLHQCPNREHVGWDPVSRFLVSLDYARWIQSFQIHKIFIGLLDSPTWPSLRSLVEAIGILIFGPDTLLSIWMNYLTFLILGFSFLFILFQEIQHTSSTLFIPILGILWLLSIQPIRLYTFSGMLEIQGGLFLLLTIYAFQRVSQNKYLYLIYYILLLQTKYPYAILFNFTLMLTLILRSKLWKIEKIQELFSFYWQHTKHSPILLFIPIPLTILILYKLSYIPLPGKSKLYTMYGLFLLLMLDVTIFSIQYIHLFLKSQYRFSFFTALGGFWYIGIHPDRFGATFSTIQHIQIEGDGYFLQVFKDIPFLAYFLIGVGLFYGIHFWRVARRFQCQEPLSYLSLMIHWIHSLSKQNPYLWFSLLGILGQSLFTTNQQTRHIYHIYPTVIMGILYSLSRVHWKKYLDYVLFFFITLFLFFLFTNKPNVCYAGSNLDVREIPNFIKKQSILYLNQPIVFINDIHPTHINKPDSEVQIYIQAYQKKFPIYKYPKLPEEKEFSLVRISESCNPELLKNYIKNLLKQSSEHSYGIAVMEIPNPDGLGCWEQVEFYPQNSILKE